MGEVEKNGAASAKFAGSKIKIKNPQDIIDIIVAP
jgi:hypothetical protein